MAVVTLYMSDLDPQQRMFKSKKEADEHDKKLELAESLSSFIARQVDDIGDDLAETLGMLIAENKDRITLAFKGKPEALFATSSEEQNSEASAENSDNKSASDKVVSLK
jgi:uncharacterized protein